MKSDAFERPLREGEMGVGGGSPPVFEQIVDEDDHWMWAVSASLRGSTVR
jgi:hypothetical protein